MQNIRGKEITVADAVNEVLLKVLAIKLKNTLESMYWMGERARGVEFV